MKKNKKENSSWESFKYNYNNLEGFDSLVKLIIFFVICIIIILLAKTTINSDRKAAENRTSTTQVSETDSLKKVLDTLIKKEATVKITQGDYVAIVKNVKEVNGEITGLFQDSSKQLKEFKISDQKVYEIVLDEEVENEELFSNVNIDFVIPSVLVGILEENKMIKTTNGDNAKYTYEYIDGEKTYNIIVSVVLNNVDLISISNDNISYEITYK